MNCLPLLVALLSPSMQTTAPKELTGHTGRVLCVYCTSDGRWAITASEDQTVRVWSLATGQELLRLEGHQALVRSAAISATGRFLAPALGIVKPPRQATAS